MSTLRKNKRIILGPKAIEYVRKRLARGHALSRHVLEKVDLGHGQVTTALPRNADLEKLWNFEEGILPSPPQSEWRRFTSKNGHGTVMIPKPQFSSYAIKTIQSFLLSGTGRLCVFENALAEPDDLVLQRYKSRMVTFQDEVYHLIVAGNDSDTDIEQAISEAGSSLDLNGVLTSLPGDEAKLSARREITPDMLSIMAQRVDKILFRAWDGEAFLVWNRRELR
jgi:hypothetical protein